ncbi:shikimate dehydrogenase [Anaerosporobacter mobilis DSM 15930]|uniref:Shikimate dehydrogenase n=1 Tax=Anaerosporobacter mobilis DSM 15930 TaxID=1120996 RepID=A0A1M7M341_9FIRM|nr:shikimate dehydrogenase [Anaerosporobacter mobilis]SHM84959.1 shikimate dehydrogenase [Anaerosporobacter mobilis DSM 15930]
MEYGLIGEKLGHSFSKEIHEKLADYQYNITPLTREEFPEFMKARGFKAINVTIPYKCDVIPYLDEMDSNAKSIGAVNTIVNKEGKLIGHNTDFSGFLYMVEHHKVTIEGKKILVIGNGGASKAVIAVLNHLQAKEIIIIDIVSGPGVITKEEAVKNHTDVEVIINTSPVGMYPNVDQSPIDLTLFPHCKAVLDIIYNPLQTKLTKQASELGMQAVNGLEMLVGQAKYAVEFFLDKSIDDDVIDPIYNQIMTDMMK